MKSTWLAGGKLQIESDLYRLTIDPQKGGRITSVVGKTMGNKEFVDENSERSFNELRGNFYKDRGFKSSTDQLAKVRVLEETGASVRVVIDGTISGHPFTQEIAIVQGQKRIDMKVSINWNGNPVSGMRMRRTINSI